MLFLYSPLGDDMLAFHCDDQGEITHVLFCEAKCTANHSAKLIAEAHRKSSDSKLIPNDCLTLIGILEDYAISDSKEAQWIKALRRLWLSAGNPTHERCDLVTYICGLPPAQEKTVIIPEASPHQDYIAKRRLEAVEIHLHDVDGLVQEAYQVLAQLITCSFNETELSILWDKVIFHIPKKHQKIIRENCKLIAIDNRTAVIGINLLEKFRDVQRRIAVIQYAFQLAGYFTSSKLQQKIDIRLKVEYIRVTADEEQVPVERPMIQPDEETVSLASQLIDSLVGSGLPPTLARLYSHYTRLRENQPGLQTWSRVEANSRLEDVMRLLEAASIQRQAEDDQWQRTVLRAGEILEWLPVNDVDSNEISTRLLSAACYQLAGYPARALGILREETSLDNESRILVALLKADFVELWNQISKYWSQTILETQSPRQLDLQQGNHSIEIIIIRETVSALGVLCAVMRWGIDSRVQKALDKLTAVSKVVLHGRNPYSWILSKLCAEVAATYVTNSMRQGSMSPLR